MFPSEQRRKLSNRPAPGETAVKLAALREELCKIERAGWSQKTGGSVALGIPEIDILLSGENLFHGQDSLHDRGFLQGEGLSQGGDARKVAGGEIKALHSMSVPPGLRRGCLHEFSGEGAEGFTAILSGRLKGPLLWCADALSGSDLYPPGLAVFGLDYRRLIVVRCRKPQEILAAMEDGLRCRTLAGVVGELDTPIGLTASRRLQLAAESSGVTGFLVRPSRRSRVTRSTGGNAGGPVPSAAFSRWSVTSARNIGCPPGTMTWRLSLQRCRNGGSGAWTVRWDAKTYRFPLVAEAADGQADPSAGQRLVG